MKLKALLLSFLVCLPFGTALSKAEDPPLAWVKVNDFSDENITMYYDANTRKRMKSDDKDVAYVTILFSSKNEIPIDVNGTEVKTRSQVKLIAVHCKSLKMIQIGDFYFSVAIPKKNDTVVAEFEHNLSPSNSRQIDANSPLFKVACPSYI